MVVGGRTVTGAIHVTSEVVGPVDRVTAGSLSILGQQVDIAHLPRRSRIRPGDVIAVFGIRRPDGKIVASLIEARPDETQYLVRGLAIAKSGALLVGRLKVGSQSSRLAAGASNWPWPGHRTDTRCCILWRKRRSPIAASAASFTRPSCSVRGDGSNQAWALLSNDPNDEPKPAGIVRAFLDVRFDREGHVVSASRQAGGSQSPDQPGVPAQRTSNPGDVQASPATRATGWRQCA